MKSICARSRLESPCYWCALSLLLLGCSGPGFPQESEDSRAIAAEAPDSKDPSPGIGDGEAESGQGEAKSGSFLRPQEESEVLEERRAGAEKVEDALPQELKKTGLYWDLGPHYDALDGNLRLVFGSRLHLDSAYYDESSAIEAEIGESEDDIEARRAFVEAAGVLYRQFEFKAQFNFANAFDVRDLYVGLVKIPFVSAVRVGHIREPFGLDMMTGSSSITFMERALTTVFAPNRNLGVLMHRRFTETRRLYTAVGIFQNTVNNPDFSELEENFGDGNYALTARVTGLAFASEDRRELLHLGVAGSYRKPSDDTLQFKSRPESDLANTYVDTGEFRAEDELRLGGEIATVLGPLSLQGEFTMSVVNEADDDVDFENRVFPAFYLMGSYVLTGEHRRYREQVGAFGRVHPDNPFPLEGWGAWEVAARYSYLDLDSKDIEGGVLHDWTLGLNWYLNHYSRVMFNYVLAHPEGLDFAHIAQMRLQIAF